MDISFVFEKNGESDQFFIWLKGEEVGCGTIMQARKEDDFNYLEAIEIYPEYRNQGIGTKALLSLANMFHEIVVAPDNQAAARLYDKFGTLLASAEYSRFGFAIDQGYGVFVI